MSLALGELPEPLEPNVAALSHQRPDGDLNDRDLIPEEEWNRHQKVAEATHDIATVANAITVLGAVATIVGIEKVAKGKYAQGAALITIGRAADLLDGYVSKRYGTRGKTGAAVDAFADKGLTLYASGRLAQKGVISPTFAVATVAQQARIAAENIQIEKAGGHPNPSKAGKYGMAAIWGAVLSRGAEAMAKSKGSRSAGLVGGLALATEVTSLGISEETIRGYRKQRKSMK